MSVICVVDGLLGDSGKGKIVDILAQDAGAVVRYCGGSNAGRTIVNEHGSFKVHLFPSGAFNDNVLNIIGPAVAFDPIQFFEEYDKLIEQGFNPRVLISDRVKILFPFHKYLNQVEEEYLGKNSFGSTCKGITPHAVDVFGKFAITIDDLLNRDDIEKLLHRNIEMKNCLLKHYYNRHPILLESIEPVLKLKERLKPFVGDARKEILKLISNEKKVIFEGQLGSIRDISMGIYPHISSSPSFLAGYAPVSCGINPSELTHIYCAIKAYVSYVGSGDFPTEMEKDFADPFREKAGEYGTTSGRPRRLGYFDCVMAKYGIDIQGTTDVFLTCLDLLDDWDQIPVCVYYTDIRTMEAAYDFPLTNDLKYMTPVYEYLPGWKTDISKCKSWDDLPVKAKQYVEFIENKIGMKIRFIGVGKDRDQFIDRNFKPLKYLSDNPPTFEEYYNSINNNWAETL